MLKNTKMLAPVFNLGVVSVKCWYKIFCCCVFWQKFECEFRAAVVYNAIQVNCSEVPYLTIYNAIPTARLIAVKFSVKLSSWPRAPKVDNRNLTALHCWAGLDSGGGIPCRVKKP